MEEADHVTGLIPEIYYDLIARVAAGVPLVLIFVFQNYSVLEAAKISVTDWTFFTAVLGLGYLVGHFLTTISVVLNALIWTPILSILMRKAVLSNYKFKSTSPQAIIGELYHRIDWVARKDKSGGVVLKKMEAACALTDNLLSAWLLVVLYVNFIGPIDVGLKIGVLQSILIALFLIISMAIRRIILIARQDSFLQLLKFHEEHKS
jgi:hypothetical protein